MSDDIHTCHADCPCHEGGEPTPDFIEAEPTHLPALLHDLGLVGSRSEARRLIAQEAVQIEHVVISDQDAIVQSGDLIQVGRERVVAP